MDVGLKESSAVRALHAGVTLGFLSHCAPAAL